MKARRLWPDTRRRVRLLKMVLPKDGEIRMPKGKPPLNELEIALITNWIQQGAQDDTPPDAKPHYDAEHPPLYSQPPVVTSLDFSPDGALVAVAGFHEVLLYDRDGSQLKGRLVGLASGFNRCVFRRTASGSRWLVVIRHAWAKSRSGTWRSANWPCPRPLLTTRFMA